ncbi:MAG: hypothetical protein JSV16_11535 [Candidatus Hydrogenedentota bacterium]|nr:MAG: hypothetical protein JSV16_11535 [Candidatus Hydrogenedentota bacterium]
MLDPDLQKELKNSSRVVLFLHLSMLSEPVIYVIVALVLREAARYKGMEGTESFLSFMRSAFVLVSVSVVPAIILLRRRLFAPERLIPPGADMEKIAMLYSRAQLICDVLAAVPATLGFVFFLIDGSIDFLVLLSVVSMVTLIFTFPRYETLEGALMTRIMRGETIELGGKEF